jgi:CheY-like chemotaxis protein
MLNDQNRAGCGILYIDDEEKALKYFRMGFSTKYNVFTAASGREGIEILRREHRNIGIVISDQRMPEMLGAEVLGTVRMEFPHIVRILTTAYSDLDSAIQAVNKGHIYQYVVKPWELTELEMVLQRAADYYQVLTERNELLALKLGSLQRIVCSDRVKGLMLAARSWAPEEAAGFRRALVSLIQALPESLSPLTVKDSAFSPQDFEMSTLIRDEYGNAARCIELLDTLGGSVEALRPRDGAVPESISAQVDELETGSDRWGQIAKDRLKSFLGILARDCSVGAEAVRVARNGGCVELRVDISGSQMKAGDLAKLLFGLLVEKRTSDASILLFQALVALAKINTSLRLDIRNAASPDEAPLSVVFPCAVSDSAEEAIAALYGKFSQWDISKL